MAILLELLPSPDLLREQARTLAALDAILSPEWQYRWYSFDAAWSEDAWMASMRDGSGSHWFLVRMEAGYGLIGFSLDAYRAGGRFPHILDPIPEVLRAGFADEPAFDNAMFAAWWLNDEPGWNTVASEPPDGAEELLRELVGGAPAYVEFVAEVYEQEIPPTLIAKVFEEGSVTRRVAQALNPGVTWGELEPELLAMNFPTLRDPMIDGIDALKTLEQLEDFVLGPVEFPSSLVIRCHALHTKPLAEFVPKDLRVLVGQKFSLPFVIPLALATLDLNPLLEAEFYTGDLFNAVLAVPPSYWQAAPKQRAWFVAIVNAVETADPSLILAIDAFGQSNPA